MLKSSLGPVSIIRRCFSTTSPIFERNSDKANKHAKLLSKYYTPDLLQSIQITESLVEPQDFINLKLGGRHSKSKVAPKDENSDYSLSDPEWDEPILYPNQTGKRTPYPPIPVVRSPDNTMLTMKFDKGTEGDKPKSKIKNTNDIARELSQLLDMDEGYLKSLAMRPLVMKRVSHKTNKGSIAGFFALTVVGDRRGSLGLGIGKSLDGMRVAASKAHWNAIKNMQPIKLYENRTIVGDFDYKFHGVKMRVRSAPEGFGLRVNHIMYEICQAAGIKDLGAKIYKSRNPMLIAQGFVKALDKQQSIEELAANRGKKIVDMRKVYYSQ
ncbi:37S ribosomal protein S5 mitochondrial [Spathaspora sp. JA1]|nr:37S ribosomal protein S5 mitochondrial [Spathaspora sp. JA1]